MQWNIEITTGKTSLQNAVLKATLYPAAFGLRDDGLILSEQALFTDIRDFRDDPHKSKLGIKQSHSPETFTAEL